MTLSLFIAVAAFICTILNAIGRCPVWVPLFLLSCFALLQVVPR